MRADTERVNRRAGVPELLGVPERRGTVLTAVCALTLATGVACAADEEGGADRLQNATGPLNRGDVPAEERADLESVFEDAGVNGTFVLYDAVGRSATVVGPAEAHERWAPASTFAFVTSLVALQTGAVEDVDEALPAEGGSPTGPDTSLREGFPAAGAPADREVARRVGHERMAVWVDRFDYGNRTVGGEDAADRFWLEGQLEISAMEQTGFLASLAREELPVDTEHQRAVREIAVAEELGGHTLYAGPGRSEGPDPVPGWWVGWVERGEDLHTFALRVDAEEHVGLGERLGRELLVELEVLPPEAVS